MVVLAPVALAVCGPALPTALVLVRLALALAATVLWMVLLAPVPVRHRSPVTPPVSCRRGIVELGRASAYTARRA